MTVNYHLKVRTSHPWTLFNLLCCWKASIWKAVLPHCIVWLVAYWSLSITYRCGLSEDRKRTFESVVYYFNSKLKYLPLEFLMGYFVTIIFNRWTTLYQNIGFIDNVGLMTAEYVRGRGEESRLLRRGILRFCSLGQIMMFRDISMRVRRRFPTLDTIVAGGFMLPHEKDEYEKTDARGNPQYWVAFRWAFELVEEARRKGHIESDYFQQQVVAELRTFRGNIQRVCNLDWTPFPMIYPTVVSLTVHFYFVCSVIGRQLVEKDEKGKEAMDVYFPFVGFIELVLYMGWLKVAETILNPFGEDDDDFEANALIDRNITMGLMIVDRGYNNPPELRKDVFWNDAHIKPLYSEESSLQPNHPYRGSVSHIKVPANRSSIRMIPHSQPDGEESTVHGLHSRSKSSVHVPVRSSGLLKNASTATLRSFFWDRMRASFRRQRTESEGIQKGPSLDTMSLGSVDLRNSSSEPKTDKWYLI